MAAEANREPTLADVVHAVTLLAEDVQSLRRSVLDELGALRHLVQALDRDVQSVARWIAEQE